jgi:hypothetical protein
MTVLGRAYDMKDPAKVNAIPNVHEYCGKVCPKVAGTAAELIMEAAESE